MIADRGVADKTHRAGLAVPVDHTLEGKLCTDAIPAFLLLSLLYLAAF